MGRYPFGAHLGSTGGGGSFPASSQEEGRELPSSFPRGGQGASQRAPGKCLGTSWEAPSKRLTNLVSQFSQLFPRSLPACCARRRNCADRSLGNAFARLHCCRRDMVCWLLCSTKLRVREQPKSSASEMLSQDYIAVGVTWFIACCLRRHCARNAASEMLSQDCVAVSVSWFVACCARRSCARISAQGL